MRGRLALLAVVAAGLAAPPDASAVDHVWLSVDSAQLGDGWRLSAAVTSPDFDPVSQTEILGVTLSKRWSARATESHALRLHHKLSTVAFDGQRGRWRTAGIAGGPVKVDMTIRSTSEPQAVDPDESLPFGCRGAFLRRLVNLHGTFVVRTGTAAFRTVRRVHLTGVVTYNAGGPVQCGALVGGTCAAEAQLSASERLASLFAEPSRRRLVVTFRQSNGWHHVLSLSRLTVPAAEPPTIRIEVPASTPARGTLTFTARESSEGVEGPCRVTKMRGDLAGRLRVRFTGWGVRTFAATSATYRRTAVA
jgi:hypothetical protein